MISRTFYKFYTQSTERLGMKIIPLESNHFVGKWKEIMLIIEDLISDLEYQVKEMVLWKKIEIKYNEMEIMGTYNVNNINSRRRKRNGEIISNC